MAPPKVLSTWARRQDDAADEWAREVVDPWARAAEFSTSHLWGEAEAAVLAREYPPLPATAALRTFRIVTWAGLVVFLALPTVGASMIGFILTALGTTVTNAGAARDLLVGSRLAFIVSNVVALTALGLWHELGRRRTWFGLSTSAVTLSASIATYVWLLAHADGLPKVPWLSVLVPSAGLFALLGLVLALISPREGEGKNSRRKPPQRGPRGEERQRCLLARHRLLEILQERRLVHLDEADKVRVKEMPLGYWAELDGLDEREWRRVLEYRHVGWRDFDTDGPKDSRHRARRA